MPKKYFICPDSEWVPIVDCLKECRMKNRCCPLGYLEFAGQQRVLDLPSVTELIKGTREAFLQRTVDYAIDPQQEAFAIVGSMGHKHIQGNTLRFTFSGITGEPDELFENGLVDYKVVGSYKVMLALGLKKEKHDTGRIDKYGKPVYESSFIYTGEHDIREYVLQDNMYALMAAEEGYPIEWMRNFLIVRDGGLEIASRRGIDRLCYYIDIPFMERDECLLYFGHKKDLLNEALTTKEMPRLCSGEESWEGRKCGKFCAVSKFCVGNAALEGR